MLLFKLILFIGVFLAIIYGVELCMPPFGQLYYTNPLEILVSLSQTLSYKLKISKNISMVVTILIVGILPLFITIMTGRITNKKKKKLNIGLSKKTSEEKQKWNGKILRFKTKKL